jgi:hypothetical protein
MQPRHELPPQDIIDQAKAKSNDIEPKLERWLKNNLRKYGSEFCLVVHDGSVESDMAWELVFVNIDPNDLQIPDLDLYGEVPIGALCTVVRWIPGLRWHETYLYPDEARAIKGKVMYYLDHAGVANSGIEQNLLKKFSSEAHNSIRNLIDQQLYSDIALVYLGCHGTPVDYGQVRTLILGPLFPHGEITVYNLASLPYLDPTSPRPLVIVNACYSAWTIEHERSRHGAPVAFLKTITKNFIGTIGPVDTQNAAQIATKLLENATSHEEGIRPAAILRDMRAEVVRQHINGGVNEWRVYLDTFMYVYYGNPYTRLHLLSADIGESGVSQ